MSRRTGSPGTACGRARRSLPRGASRPPGPSRPPCEPPACGTRGRREGRTPPPPRGRPRARGARNGSRALRGEVDDRETRSAREGVDGEIRRDVPRPARDDAGISARFQPTASRRRPDDANETRSPASPTGLPRPSHVNPRRRSSGLGFSCPCGSNRSSARARASSVSGASTSVSTIELCVPLARRRAPRRTRTGASSRNASQHAAGNVTPSAAVVPAELRREPRSDGRDPREERRPAEGAPAPADRSPSREKRRTGRRTCSRDAGRREAEDAAVPAFGGVARLDDDGVPCRVEARLRAARGRSRRAVPGRRAARRSPPRARPRGARRAPRRRRQQLEGPRARGRAVPRR